MRRAFWLAVAGCGFSLILLTYLAWVRPRTTSSTSPGFIVLGPDEPKNKPLPGEVIPVRLRLLPGDELTEAVLQALGDVIPGQKSGLQVQLRPKLIGLHLAQAGLGVGSLRSGRLPSTRDEILAGPDTSAQKQLRIGDDILTVVGRLKPDAAQFTGSYLVPLHEPTDELFLASDPSVHPAKLIRLTPEQMRNRQVLRQLEAAYPAPKFTRITPVVRLARGTYYLFLTGQGLFFLGGSGALIGLFRWLAPRVRTRWLAAPLQEIRQRSGLLWAVHLTYFGLVLLGALVIYEWPALQTVLMMQSLANNNDSSTPLSVVDRAYGSGSTLHAATVTFLSNFLLGSIVLISVPSVVLPGLGAVMAAFRPVLWGLLFSPTTARRAWVMVPQTVTMLLEGEGYILAAFFGLLIPVFLLQAGLGATKRSRYGRAVLLNLQANGLVALVLAIAACYEAKVIIRMMR